MLHNRAMIRTALLLAVPFLCATAKSAMMALETRPARMPDWAEAVPGEPLSNTRGASGFAKLVRDRVTKIEMILVAPGLGIMGDSQSIYSDERPRRSIEITVPFYLARTEITVEQWQAVMGDKAQHEAMPVTPRNLPASVLSKDDVEAYLARTEFRLPTEAEWEYAARAGRVDLDDAVLDEEAWHRGNSRGELKPVGTKRPNPWGFLDLSGNVWEWCSDRYDAEYLANLLDGTKDPRGAQTGARFSQRGGSAMDDPLRVRFTSRSSASRDRRQFGVGFRVARDAYFRGPI